MAALSEPSTGLEVTRRHPLIGTEVRGLDLATPMDDATFGELHALWMEHLLLVFPDQPLTDEQHIAFGRRFGELEIHPSLAHRSSRNQEIYRVSNVDEAGNIIPSQETAWQYINLSWLWHTDSSFREVPSMGSILHGIETTTEGGNTFFANMYAAYDDLSADMQARIEGRWVIHDHDFIIKQSKELSARQNKGQYDAMPPVLHPLVQLHPVTRRRCLFLSPHTMVNIQGMPETEGRKLLDDLTAHATQPEYVYKHIWAKDDIIMWDNRCTMHSVEPFDNASTRRIMHRVTLVGEGKPIAAR